MNRRTLVSFVIATALTAPAAADPTFEKDVRPILKAHCFQCHGEAAKPKGGVDVRLRRFLVDAEAVVPGKPDESPLIELVRDGSMPKAEKKLSPKEIDTLERWVAAGAKTARPEPEKLAPGQHLITDEERSHWAYRPVRRPAVPDLAPHPVDAFLLAKLKEKGLSFSPEASRAALIRRAYFDLLGLPPTPDEVRAFAADESSNAYEKLIDRLLASPRYGERWGRHWLDVAGYADSEGYTEEDKPRDDAWPYRDYVIRSFNADTPFDRFLVEQLAGDELVPPPHRNLSPDQVELLTATGFLRMAPDGTGGKTDDPVAARHAVVQETIKVVSGAVLGLTVGCAECHDHRYDPIPQRDYYRLRAVFEPALDPKNWRSPQQRQVSPLSDAEQKQAAAAEAEAKKVEAELKPKLAALRDEVFALELKALPEEVRDQARAAGLAFQKNPKAVPPDQSKLLELYPGLKVVPNQSILNLFLQKYGRGQELADLLVDNAKRAAAARAGKPKAHPIRALTEVPGQVPTTVVFDRGDRARPGAAVPPGDLSVLTAEPVDFPADDPAVPTTGRRLAFAKHLTSGTHPLTARVLVNRFWMHHFGRGLVNTPADFGTQGERPSHPELLDWLADEFARTGWSLKAFHRLVMTSAAYRQSSARHPAGDAADEDNRLVWRMPVRRLDAEAIRDAMLTVGGGLNVKAFGPPVPVTLDANGQPVVGAGTFSADREECRRSVYVQHRRSATAYLLQVFDAPNPDPNCESRICSTAAPQALVLMNSRFVMDQARAFADRVKAEAGDDPARRAARAWAVAYGIEPSAADLAGMTAYLDKQTRLLADRPVVDETPDPAAVKKKGRPRGPQPLAALPAGDPPTLALASLCQVLLESNRFLYVE